MKNDSFAVLKKESPFYCLFPGGRVPILPFGPEQASLVGTPESEVYMLDVNRLSQDEISKVAEAVAKARGGTAAEVMDFLLAERRLPIRKSQVESVEGVGIDMRMMV